MDLSFKPTARVARASTCSAGISGLSVMLPTAFPSGNVGSGADYSLDFTSVIGTGERVVYALMHVSNGATIAWDSIYGNYATTWISWQTGGWKKITASVLTDTGNSYSATGGINIGCASLITLIPPEYAPNAYVIGDVYVPDADGYPLILG